MATTPYSPPPGIPAIARMARAKLLRAQGPQVQPWPAVPSAADAHQAALAERRAGFTARLDGIVARVQAVMPDIPIAIAKDGDGRTYTVLGEALSLRYYDLPARAKKPTMAAPGSVIKVAGAVTIPRCVRDVACWHAEAFPPRSSVPAIGPPREAGTSAEGREVTRRDMGNARYRPMG